MLYHEGIFHTFYCGTKWEKFESIGYAYSFDIPVSSARSTI